MVITRYNYTNYQHILCLFWLRAIYVAPQRENTFVICFEPSLSSGWCPRIGLDGAYIICAQKSKLLTPGNLVGFIKDTIFITLYIGHLGCRFADNAVLSLSSRSSHCYSRPMITVGFSQLEHFCVFLTTRTVRRIMSAHLGYNTGVYEKSKVYHNQAVGFISKQELECWVL